MTFTGSKYTPGLDTAEIAKRFRQDVKDAKAKGDLPKGLKLSVRIERYAGGSSINVSIEDSGGVRVCNPARLAYDRDHPHDGYNLPVGHEARDRYTPEAKDLEAKLEHLLEAYNRDDSDSQSDYFCVHFYSHIRWGAAEGREREEFEKGTLPPLPPKPEAEPEAEPKPAAPVPAEKSTRPPKPPPPELPKAGFGIRFNWSESGHVDCARVFGTFEEANVHLKTAEILELRELNAAGEEWLGYRKTSFTVAIDGDEYEGRYDIGSDAPTIEAHVLDFCAPDNPWTKTQDGRDELAEWGRKFRAELDRQNGKAPEPEPKPRAVVEPKVGWAGWRVVYQIGGEEQ